MNLYGGGLARGHCDHRRSVADDADLRRRTFEDDPRAGAGVVDKADLEGLGLALHADAQVLGRRFLGAPEAKQTLVERGAGQTFDRGALTGE